MITPAGKGAQQLSRHIFIDSKAKLTVHHHTGVVQYTCPFHYQYLGSFLDYKRSPNMEIQRRAAVAYSTALPLKAPFFNKQAITHKAKAMIGTAILLSQATYASQTWPKLNKSTEKTFSKAILRIYKIIHGKQTTIRPLTETRIAADIGMLLPSEYLKQQRLLYFRRALEHAPAALFALLQAEAVLSTSYRAMLNEDIRWLRRNLPPKITGEQLSQDTATAVSQIVSFEPTQWRKLVKQATQSQKNVSSSVQI